MTHAERIENESKRLNTLFVIENGRGYYVENGQPYTRSEFEAKYPVPLLVQPAPKHKNIDGRKDWMY